MRCADPVDVSDEIVQRMLEQASERLTRNRDDDPLLRIMTRLCVAAAGGHVAIDDEFLIGCYETLASLKPKQKRKWKSRVDDRTGQRRNVFFEDGFVKIRDDRGVAVPLVPLTISTEISDKRAAAVAAAEQAASEGDKLVLEA